MDNNDNQGFTSPDGNINREGKPLSEIEQLKQENEQLRSALYQSQQQNSQYQSYYQQQNQSSNPYPNVNKKSASALKIVGIVLLCVIGIPVIVFGACILMLSSF